MRLSRLRSSTIAKFRNSIIAEEQTPYICVINNLPNLVLPQSFVKEKAVILNIAPSAVKNFQVLDSVLLFDSSFSRTIYSLRIPIGAISSIYSKESRRGIFFNELHELHPPLSLPKKKRFMHHHLYQLK